MIPNEVLAQYSIGDVKTVVPVSIGLIHQTYQITTDLGTFILQRLHPLLSSPAIGKDFFVVTTFLNDKKFPAPKCVLTKTLKILATDFEGRTWRMQTFLEGKSYSTVRDAKIASEAGRTFGMLHATLAGLKYDFKSKKILHETEKIFTIFTRIIKKQWKSPLMGDVAADVAFVSQEMHKVLLPRTLPMRAIHGDPKISNLLFDVNGKACGLVDLDTCNRRPLLVETGDMFRSWCGNEEDDARNEFHLDIFRSGWKGYAKASDGLITARERRLVPLSVATITLELASRFLVDYFKDDYFGWDSSRYSSRRAHNLARVRGQLSLYRDIWKKMDRMKKIVG